MPRAPVYPKGLRVRGKRLWREVLAVRPRLGPGERVLLEEACRIADRLEALNEVIVGEEHPEFQTKDGTRFVVVVEPAQQEARLATIALRQVMISLDLNKMQVPEDRPTTPAPSPEPAKSEPDDEEKGKRTDPIDEISARRGRRDDRSA